MSGLFKWWPVAAASFVGVLTLVALYKHGKQRRRLGLFMEAPTPAAAATAAYSPHPPCFASSVFLLCGRQLMCARTGMCVQPTGSAVGSHKRAQYV